MRKDNFDPDFSKQEIANDFFNRRFVYGLFIMFFYMRTPEYKHENIIMIAATLSIAFTVPKPRLSQFIITMLTKFLFFGFTILKL